MPAPVFKPYTHQPYPSWRYHASKEAKLVHSEKEDVALGSDWSAAPVPKAPVANLEDENAMLKRQLAEANAFLKSQMKSGKA